MRISYNFVRDNCHDEKSFPAFKNKFHFWCLLCWGANAGCIKQRVQLTKTDPIPNQPPDTTGIPDSSILTQYSPVGVWIGYVVNHSGDPATDYTLALLADSTLTFTAVAKNTPHLGHGTWSLNDPTIKEDSTLNMHIYADDGLPGNVSDWQQFTTIVSAAKDTIGGTWVNLTNQGTENAGWGIIWFKRKDNP